MSSIPDLSVVRPLGEPKPRNGRPPRDADVIVIGSGLAGLAAAAFAGRAGASVVVLERSSEAGGRAATHDNGGFLFNLGPHALYDGGPASGTLAELGVRYSGRRPSASGGLALRRGRLHGLPGGLVSLLATDLLTLGGKLELARVLGSLAKIDAARLRGLTLREWLNTTFRDETVRELLEGLMRLTAYANDPGRSCAAASVAQLQGGLGRGVLYVDGGWNTLVAGLRRAAEEAGVSVRTACRAGRVRVTDEAVEVDVPGSGPLRAGAVVLAVPPAVAASLVEGPGRDALGNLAAAAVPVKAACLDLGLRRLPQPRRLFVVGVDRPLYFSVHSASARLAPDGAATVHVAKYLGSDDEDPKAVEAELETFCDLVQPGWRTQVAQRRFLPSMLVTGDLVAAGRPRTGTQVPGARRLLVAGDWVDAVGNGNTLPSMLADAALGSGREAGRLAAAEAARPIAIEAA